MLTYLLRRPMEYTSHVFVHCSIAGYVRKAIGHVYKACGHQQPAHTVLGFQDTHDRIKDKPRVLVTDYVFRPAQLDLFPLYFFIAGCDAVAQLDHRSME